MYFSLKMLDKDFLNINKFQFYVVKMLSKRLSHILFSFDNKLRKKQNLKQDHPQLMNF